MTHIQSQISTICDQEIRDLKAWYETSGYPYGALKACYAAVGSVRDYVQRSYSERPDVSLFHLVRGLEENRYKFLELWYDEFGLASSTYKSLVEQIRSLDKSRLEVKMAEPLSLPKNLYGNGRVLALCYGERMEIWDLQTSSLLDERPLTKPILSWSDDGTTLFDEDGTPVVLNERTRALLPTSPPILPRLCHRDELYGPHESEPGVLKDGRGKVYDLLPHPNRCFTKRIPYPFVTISYWARAGKSFVTEQEDPYSDTLISRLSLWNLETGTLTRAWDYWCWLDDMKLSPDGNWLACLYSKRLQILNCTDGQELADLPMNKDIKAIGWSIDGRDFYALHAEGVVSVRIAPKFDVRGIVALTKGQA